MSSSKSCLIYNRLAIIPVRMKNILAFLGLLLVSVLIYNCSGSKSSAVSTDFRLPEFEPNPSGRYLSPKESMKTMHLPPGYRMQLVASEPMIKEPVAIAWDGNGRMYVMEMRTYMQLSLIHI